MDIRAITIDLLRFPRGYRLLVYTPCAIFCIGSIAFGTRYALHAQSSLTGLLVLFSLIALPLFASVVIVKIVLTTVRPWRFGALENSLRLSGASVSAERACEQFAAFLFEFDTEFVSRSIAPEVALPFADEFQRIEAAINKPLPRIWLLGATNEWKRFASLRRAHRMRPPAAQRVFLPRHLQARLAKEIVLSVLASSVSLAISEVARRFGLISTQSFPWLVALTSLVLIAFVVFSMRRGVDRRAMWLSFDDQPILEYRRLSSVESSLDLEWDDLVCIASIRQPQKFRATDLGRFDWRVVSLRHRFVITVPNIEELPVPWRNALIALLGPPPHHSDTMLHPTADLN